MRWCCAAFQGRYQEAGHRGIAILVGHNYDRTPRFTLQYRVADVGLEGTVQSTDDNALLAIVTESQIQYCPWCGRKLSKWYGRSIESLIRPEYPHMGPE